MVALLLFEALCFGLWIRNHEYLHILFSKDQLKFNDYGRCDFVCSFQSELSTSRQILTASLPNILAFCVGGLAYWANHENFTMRLIPSLFLSIAIVSFFPISQDGMVLWVIISRNHTEFSHLFTNDLKSSSLTTLLNFLTFALWFAFFVYGKFNKNWVVLELVLNLFISWIVWKDYARRQMVY